MRKTMFILVLLLLSVAFAQVEIRWYVGIGAGKEEAQVTAQRAIVDEFNASQDRIKLVLEVVNETAFDVLATQIAAGGVPDIVGPMGIRGRASFPGAWLDLSDLITSNDYDLSDFDPALVDFYRLPDQGQLGLPFAVYPSYITYNKDLFDEAGLAYPPSEFGAPYVDADGNERPWDIDTLRDLAMQLTVDANGNDATSPDFDPDQIVQFGFDVPVNDDLRGRAALFGPGNFVDADGKAVIPENWITGLEWQYDAMWKDHFYPTATYKKSTLLLEGNSFDSGNVAMADTHLWYEACCMTTITANWDIAPKPTYNGAVTAKLHADTFSIMKGSKHPQEAFEVLTYLLGPAAERLVSIYGGMPARKSSQENYITTFAKDHFPDQEIHWNLVGESLSHPDIPNHEEGMPNYNVARARYDEFNAYINSTPGLDMNKELETLRADLQRIFDEDTQ
jgi:multiple sugar transport system substrate-binding protein